VIKPEGIRSAEKLGRPEVKQEEPAPTDSGGADYRLLAALMQQLPKDGKWSKARRDRWIQAISASVDLLVEITVEDGGN
jgi:ABC-type sulfate transport system substrate-binding protein